MAESKSQDRTCERHGFSDSTGLDGQERGTVIKRPVPIALGIGPSFFLISPPLSLRDCLNRSKVKAAKKTIWWISVIKLIGKPLLAVEARQKEQSSNWNMDGNFKSFCSGRKQKCADALEKIVCVLLKRRKPTKVKGGRDCGRETVSLVRSTSSPPFFFFWTLNEIHKQLCVYFR